MEKLYMLNRSRNNDFILYTILGALIFFLFVVPNLQTNKPNAKPNVKERLENTNGIQKIDENICSKQCCKFVQWPVPHDVKVGDIPEEQLKNYIPSNLSCNYGSNNGGCLCITKDNFNYLSHRGGNAGSNK
jgi:hypothetical protein